MGNEESSPKKQTEERKYFQTSPTQKVKFTPIANINKQRG